MKLQKSIYTIILLFIAIITFSQEIKDEKHNVIGVSATYAYQFSGGDLADRFGSNSNIGITAWYKLKSNWVFGFDYTYMFGKNLTDEASTIFDNIKTSDGHIIDKYGQFSAVLLSERGFYTGLKIGKVIPFTKSNLNSGLLISFGMGLLQHKIFIENDGNVTPQIIGDYKKGYDKLTNGLALQQFIGYMYIGKSKLANFFVGVEFTQGFTQSRRDYDFNLMMKDETKRLDLLYSIRVGWIVPFYKREARDFYIN